MCVHFVFVAFLPNECFNVLQCHRAQTHRRNGGSKSTCRIKSSCDVVNETEQPEQYGWKTVSTGKINLSKRFFFSSLSSFLFSGVSSCFVAFFFFVYDFITWFLLRLLFSIVLLFFVEIFLFLVVLSPSIFYLCTDVYLSVRTQTFNHIHFRVNKIQCWMVDFLVYPTTYLYSSLLLLLLIKISKWSRCRCCK